MDACKRFEECMLGEKLLLAWRGEGREQQQLG
jgi:hypothetical protein